jgi:hypothetical protein
MAMKSSKVATGQGHPPFDPSRIQSDVIETARPIELRPNFTAKLYTQLARLDDSRVAHAAKVFQGRKSASDEQSKEPVAVRSLKRAKGSDCGQWGSGIDMSGTHQ